MQISLIYVRDITIYRMSHQKTDSKHLFPSIVKKKNISDVICGGIPVLKYLYVLSQLKKNEVLLFLMVHQVIFLTYNICTFLI